MSRALPGAIRYPVTPRLVPPEKIARRLGVSLAIFAEKRAELERQGFPRPDPVLGTYCLEAVDKWIDARAGLIRDDDPRSVEAAMRQSLRAQAWAR